MAKKNASPIVQDGHPVLRKKAREIAPTEIGTVALRAVLSRMKRALAKEKDGVAIAAPQLGEGLRIFIDDPQAFDMLEKATQKIPVAGKDTGAPKGTKHKDMVFINPKIIKQSKEQKPMEEGCLSVRWKYGKVMRAQKTTVAAQDEKGRKFTLGGSGLLAQIFQHEMDHLEGILFIDKAREVQELHPVESRGAEQAK